MKNLLKVLLAGLLVLGAGAAARADTTTSRFGFSLPDVGSTGWGLKISTNFIIIDSSAVLVGAANTFTSSNTFTTISASSGAITNFTTSNSSTTVGVVTMLYVSTMSAGPITTSSLTVTGNAQVNGAFRSTGSVVMGSAGNNVVISSNVILPGTTIYSPGATASIVTDTMTAVSIAVTTLTPTNIVGVTNGAAASAADYGFYWSTCSVASVNFPTVNQYGDLVSYSLPAGDWRICANNRVEPNGATVVGTSCGIGTVTGNSSTGETIGYNMGFTGAQTGAGAAVACITPCTQVLTSGTATYYYKYNGNFSVATPTSTGCMWGWRVR